MNARLKGYSVRLGSADVHPLSFSVDFRDLVVRQDANPEAAVMNIPRLTASLEWRSLLRGKLAGDVKIERPALHLDLNHLQQEAREQVPPSERGWQDALEATFPLRINTIYVEAATVTYIDRGPGKPLSLSDLYVLLENVRNVRSPDRVYPSVIWARGTIFDRGWLAVDGHADFLATPHPGVAGRIEITAMDVDYFEPVARRYNMVVKQGSLSLGGQFEYAPTVRTAILERATLEGLRMDYVHTPKAAAQARTAAKQAVETTTAVADRPDIHLRVDRLDVVDATVAFVSKTARRPYRVSFTEASLQMRNLTNQRAAGPGQVAFRGKFMGQGPAEATASFEASPKGPAFTVKLAIQDTDLAAMNDMLQAYAGIDVTSGVFSLYSEVAARDGRIGGYVKPLFRDVVAYDPAQDREKSFGRKLKERLVGAVSKLLENRSRQEVATRVELSGRLDDPNTNSWEVALGLVQNAFFKAILPGFEQAAGRPRAPSS